MSCGGPDYSTENFEYFKNIAERNATTAIKELRYFVHYNPKHAEGNLLLGKLLMENAQEERDYYLSQHYLQEAINYSTSKSIESSTAADIYMQVQLLRGAVPGDPKKLVELAKFAMDNNQPYLSSQNYIKAAKEFLALSDIKSSQDCAQNAYSIIKNTATEPEEQDSRNKQKNYFLTSQHILATTHIINAKYPDSEKFLQTISTAKIEYEAPDFLPDIVLLSAANEVIKQASRPGLFRRMAFWSNEKKLDVERLKILLEEADGINRKTRHITRDRLSIMIWESVNSDIDKPKVPEIVDMVERYVRFYSQRMEI